MASHIRAEDLRGRPGDVLLAASALVIAALLSWWGALSAEFILDDYPVIVEQEGHILGPDGLRRAATSDRPVTELTFVLDAHRHGMDPVGWHWTNLILHVLGTLALFELVRRCARWILARSRLDAFPSWLTVAVAFIAGLIWSVHPVQTEVVSYVVQRAEALAALFSFLAMLCLVMAFEQRRQLVWCILLFCLIILAFGSKASAISLPPLLLLLDWGVLGGSFRNAMRERWPLHLLAWILFLAFIGYQVLSNELLSANPTQAVGVGLGVSGQTPLTYFLAQLEAVPTYIRLVVWPNELLIDRFDTVGSFSIAIVPGVLILLLWIGLGVAGLLRRKWWGAVLLMALVAMLPTSSIIPIIDVIVEHRLYLPLAPLATLFAGLMGWIVYSAMDDQMRPAWVPSLIVVILTGTIVMLEVVRMQERNRDYASPERLWVQVIESDSGVERARVNYASELLRQERFDEAIAYMEEILAVDPSNLSTRVNMGIALVALDRPVAAIEHLRMAEQSFSGNPSMHAALGDAERALGNLEAAKQHFRRVLERQPSDARTYLVLANVLQEQGRVEESLEVQDQAVAVLQSGNDRELLYSALMNRGSSAYRLQRWQEAAEYYQDAMAAASTQEERDRIAPYLEEAKRLSAEQETDER